MIFVFSSTKHGRKRRAAFARQIDSSLSTFRSYRPRSRRDYKIVKKSACFHDLVLSLLDVLASKQTLSRKVAFTTQGV
jgi:hypothetical protein